MYILFWTANFVTVLLNMDLSVKYLIFICDGVCITLFNVVLMSFQFILSEEYQLNFDLSFKRALQDITTEEEHYILESFC